MDTINFNFGFANNVKATYCLINEYLHVATDTDGKSEHVYFDGFIDDLTDIWGPAARALDLIGHKRGAMFNLRRKLRGDSRSDIGKLRQKRLDTRECPHRYFAVAPISYYTKDVRGNWSVACEVR